MMTADKLVEYIKKYYGGNKRLFCNEVGINPCMVSAWVKRDKVAPWVSSWIRLHDENRRLKKRLRGE